MSRSTRTGGRVATNGVIPGRIALSVGRPELPEPAGFSWRSLSEMARLESGHTPSRLREDYWGGEIPWIGIRDATANHGKVIDKTLDRVTQEGLDNSSARLLPAGTVCLSRTASVGYVVETGRPMATSQDFVNWVCGPRLNSSYLRYIFMLEQASIRRFAHGTTHQTMYYPEAKALNVLVPTRRQQDATADVLGALDDKIVANGETLRLADELVRIKFEKIGGDEISLSEVAVNVREQVNPGEIPPTTPYIGLEHVPRRRMWLSEYAAAGEAKSPKSVFKSGDVLFGKLRPYFHKVVSAGFDGVASTDILVIRAKREELAGFVLAAASSDRVIRGATATSEGTRMPRTSWASVGATQIPWCGDVAAEAFSSEVLDLARLTAQLVRESAALGRTRDELLPLLMSGKIRVRDAERQAEDVL